MAHAIRTLSHALVEFRGVALCDRALASLPLRRGSWKRLHHRSLWSRRRRRSRRRISEEGWLATVTVRKTQRLLRRRRFFARFGASAPVSNFTEAAPEQRILLQQVFAVLARVDVADRIAWTLRVLENEPFEVVATRCECSLATAKRRVARAQLELDEAMGGRDV